MKNVTVSMDDATYMRARESASLRGRSLSALVREFLEGLKAEDEFERLRQMEQDLYVKIDARARVGRASDRLDRDALYDEMAQERGE